MCLHTECWSCYYGWWSCIQCVPWSLNSYSAHSTSTLNSTGCNRSLVTLSMYRQLHLGVLWRQILTILSNVFKDTVGLCFCICHFCMMTVSRFFNSVEYLMYPQIALFYGAVLALWSFRYMEVHLKARCCLLCWPTQAVCRIWLSWAMMCCYYPKDSLYFACYRALPVFNCC